MVGPEGGQAHGIIRVGGIIAAAVPYLCARSLAAIGLDTGLRSVPRGFAAPSDPWMTTVGYFNSLRELGEMRRLAEDDVRTRAFRVTLGDLERPGLAQRDVRQIQELTSRASSSDIPRILDRASGKRDLVTGGFFGERR